MASAKISLPSASVLITSTVVPSYMVSTSSAAYALNPGRLSVIGSNATRCTGSWFSAAANSTAAMVAAPAMSDFISCI